MQPLLVAHPLHQASVAFANDPVVRYDFVRQRGTARVGCIFDSRDVGVPLIQNDVLQTSAHDQSCHGARRCGACGHVFFEPPPPALLDRYYNEEYPAAADLWYNIDADYAATKVTERAERILAIASRFGFTALETRETKSYHEIGCAFGGTVAELNRRGYMATGTELNRNAVAKGHARGNDAIAAEADTDFLRSTGRRPNVVFGFHVFEHMTDPVGYLRDLATCLASDSIVILLVPNAMALFPAAFGFMHYTWFAYPGHLNLFSAGSAACLARAAGYDLLDVGSHISRVEPDLTDRALTSRIDTPVMALIRDHLIEDGLMAEELVLVLTPRGSSAALRHAADVMAAKQRCATNATFEAVNRSLAETTALEDPAALRPDLVEQLEATREMLRQRDAALADAIERFERHEAQQAAALAEAQERARQAELSRSAVEASTCWRVTGPIRWLAKRLKLPVERHGSAA